MPSAYHVPSPPPPGAWHGVVRIAHTQHAEERERLEFEDMREARRRQAATVIQAWVRGHRVRKALAGGGGKKGGAKKGGGKKKK